MRIITMQFCFVALSVTMIVTLVQFFLLASAAPLDFSEPNAAAVAAAGYSEEKLDSVKSILEADASYGCMTVVKDEKLISSHVWGAVPGGNYEPITLQTPQRVNSISKSVVSAMFGVALQRGDITSLDEPASKYIDSWKNSLSENVTIRELLTMTSGRYYSSTADYFWPNILGIESIRDEDVSTIFSYSKYSTETLPQESFPGTEWVYNNAGVQALEVVLSEATGFYNVDDYAKKYLFDEIGMNNTRFSTELVGKPILSGGLRTTCFDLSRLGQLYLMGGKNVDGKQIIPESYVEFSTGANGPATDLNGAYAYLWWRPNHHDRDTPLPWVGAEPTYVTSANNKCIVEYATRGRDEKLLPNLPEGSYVAAGAYGYCFIVNPKENLMIAKLSASGGPFLNDCDEFYRLIEKSKEGETWQSQADEFGCSLRDSDDTFATAVDGNCLLEGTECNPIRSSWFLPSRFRTQSCCGSLSCELTYDRQFGCF